MQHPVGKRRKHKMHSRLVNIEFVVRKRNINFCESGHTVHLEVRTNKTVMITVSAGADSGEITARRSL